MARLITLIGLLTLGATQAAAQDDAATQAEAPATDLTQPPQYSGAAPGDANLEPPQEEREDMLEAVVTGGQTDFACRIWAPACATTRTSGIPVNAIR